MNILTLWQDLLFISWEIHMEPKRELACMLRSLVCCGDIRSLISCGIDFRALTNGISFLIAYLVMINIVFRANQAMGHTCRCHQCSLVDVVVNKPNSIVPAFLSKEDYRSTFEHWYELSLFFLRLQPGFVNWKLRFPSHHLHGHRRVWCQICLSDSAISGPRDLLPVSNNSISVCGVVSSLKVLEDTSISAGNPFSVIRARHCFHSMSWYAWIKSRYPCLPVYAIFLSVNAHQECISREGKITSLYFLYGRLF